MLGYQACFARAQRIRGCTSPITVRFQRHAASRLQCLASKTTGSRSKTTSSRSAEGTTSTKQQPHLTTNISKPADSSKSMRERLNTVGERIGSFFNFLVPKQEGDFGDVMMMSLSMAVLVYFSMQLYRLYAYAYFHAGSFSTMMDMMQ